MGFSPRRRVRTLSAAAAHDPRRLYPGRAVGRDCDHRHAGGADAAGRAGRPARAARRSSCVNNLRQLGIAVHDFHRRAERLSAAARKPENGPGCPTNPWTFYRWSSLAHLTPYLEESNARDALDLTVPLYGTSLDVHAENAVGVALVVPLFLCPSDHGSTSRRVSAPRTTRPAPAAAPAAARRTTPTASSTSTPQTRIADRRRHQPHGIDVRKHLGNPNGTPPRKDADVDYKFFPAAADGSGLQRHPAMEHLRRPRLFLGQRRIRCALYNHYRPPNAPVPDCVGVVIAGRPAVYTPLAGEPPRSHHPGGVNVLLADGAVRFGRRRRSQHLAGPVHPQGSEIEEAASGVRARHPARHAVHPGTPCSARCRLAARRRWLADSPTPPALRRARAECRAPSRPALLPVARSRGRDGRRGARPCRPRPPGRPTPGGAGPQVRGRDRGADNRAHAVNRGRRAVPLDPGSQPIQLGHVHEPLGKHQVAESCCGRRPATARP